MRRKATIFSLAIVLIGLFIWRTPDILEWNYNRRWKQIPITFQGDLMRFESDCSNRFSRIFGIPPLDRPPAELNEQIDYITNYISTNNIGLDTYFDISESTPYFFKCKCGNYLCIWHRGDLNAPEGAYVMARVNHGEIRNFMTVFHDEPNQK